MTDNLFWRNRIIESGAADPQELAKGYNPDNWRHHPQIQRDALEDALDSIGVLQPVLFNRSSGRVIDGHLRIELAILKGQPLIPVNYVELTDDEEALALATLDAITEQAEPIPDKLAALLERTREMTADRPGMGAMLAALKAKAGINGHQPKEDGGPQIDKAAELQKVWGVKVGDVWELGQHRLVCGDCTDRATVEAVMRGERAAIAFTSPPYNVGSLNILGNVPTLPKYRNDSDKKSYPEYLEFLINFTDILLSACDEAFINIGLVEDNKRAIIAYLMHYIEIFKDFIYWKKHTVAPHIQDGVINNLVEFVICLGDGRRKFNNAQFGQGTYWNVIEGPNASGNEYADIHKATFPLYFPMAIIENFSPSGRIILDPFLGSGTTLIAAHQLNRRCYGIEIEPSYCAVTLERWSQLTGQTPRRVAGDPLGRH